ncbi:hypothetical protein EYF80_053273 [Liparis tanakae]|uniref:Uncharacterized protein n=1 Tax=Liparis tanakae TaxID=230148 RepID=A0A4Z2F710_9TELE|nr:hypothetical protein EYF80_053273 [Liparis tanakae]
MHRDSRVNKRESGRPRRTEEQLPRGRPSPISSSATPTSPVSEGETNRSMVRSKHLAGEALILLPCRRREAVDTAGAMQIGISYLSVRHIIQYNNNKLPHDNRSRAPVLRGGALREVEYRGGGRDHEKGRRLPKTEREPVAQSMLLVLKMK